MFVIDTFFLKIARTFTNTNKAIYLLHGVNFCLSEALNIDIESLFPKQRYVFTFHEYLYEPYLLKPMRMALEKGTSQ
jgi:hypothetical protein